jgi:hypothetical protein
MERHRNAYKLGSFQKKDLEAPLRYENQESTEPPGQRPGNQYLAPINAGQQIYNAARLNKIFWYKINSPTGVLNFERTRESLRLAGADREWMRVVDVAALNSAEPTKYFLEVTTLKSVLPQSSFEINNAGNLSIFHTARQKEENIIDLTEYEEFTLTVYRETRPSAQFPLLILFYSPLQLKLKDN